MDKMPGCLTGNGNHRMQIGIFFINRYAYFLRTLLPDVNGVPKTGVLKNGLITLWKITPSDARNSQQLFRVEKM